MRQIAFGGLPAASAPVGIQTPTIPQLGLGPAPAAAVTPSRYTRISPDDRGPIIPAPVSREAREADLRARQAAAIQRLQQANVAPFPSRSPAAPAPASLVRPDIIPPEEIDPRIEEEEQEKEEREEREREAAEREAPDIVSEQPGEMDWVRDELLVQKGGLIKKPKQTRKRKRGKGLASR